MAESDRQEPLMSPDEARALMYEWVQNENLRRHGEAVAACLRAAAVAEGEDADLWETVGLLHDFDWERHPTLDEHPHKGVEILRGMGVDEVICRAVASHARHTGVSRETRLEKMLFACDELAGFINAVALMRPERLGGMTPKSVRKKMKDKAFAAAVSREDITDGAADLGVDLDAHIAFCIAALQPMAARLGL